jgi:hypothetical protein
MTIGVYVYNNYLWPELFSVREVLITDSSLSLAYEHISALRDCYASHCYIL